MRWSKPSRLSRRKQIWTSSTVVPRTSRYVHSERCQQFAQPDGSPCVLSQLSEQVGSLAVQLAEAQSTHSKSAEQGYQQASEHRRLRERLEAELESARQGQELLRVELESTRAVAAGLQAQVCILQPCSFVLTCPFYVDVHCCRPMLPARRRKH